MNLLSRLKHPSLPSVSQPLQKCRMKASDITSLFRQGQVTRRLNEFPRIVQKSEGNSWKKIFEILNLKDAQIEAILLIKV